MNFSYPSILLVLLIACGCFRLQAQSNEAIQPSANDSSAVVKTYRIPDSVFRFNTKIPVPKRSALYSALLPGLGQVYNRQYWKTGLVAAGAGALTYFIITNRKEYLTYQKDYIYRIDGNPKTQTAFPEYSDDDVNVLRTGFRKYYEYSIIAASVCYLLNILDAFTSAHLKTFDMSKDISFHPYQDQQQLGLSMVYTFHHK